MTTIPPDSGSISITATVRYPQMSDFWEFSTLLSLNLRRKVPHGASLSFLLASSFEMNPYILLQTIKYKQTNIVSIFTEGKDSTKTICC